MCGAGRGPRIRVDAHRNGKLVLCVGWNGDLRPALTFNGIAGNKESVTFNLSISGCTSTDSNPAPAPTGTASAKTKPIKLKGVACQTNAAKANYNAACTSKGKPTMTGSCSAFSSQLSTITLNSSEKWNTKIKPTKGYISDLHQDLSQAPTYIGSTGSGMSTKGSYLGSVSTTSFYTALSSAALEACEGGSETGVSTLTIDASKSTISTG